MGQKELTEEAIARREHHRALYGAMGKRVLIIWNTFERVRFFSTTNQEHVVRLCECHEKFINSDTRGSVDWLRDLFYNETGSEKHGWTELGSNEDEPIDIRDFDLLIYTGVKFTPGRNRNTSRSEQRRTCHSRKSDPKISSGTKLDRIAELNGIPQRTTGVTDKAYRTFVLAELKKTKQGVLGSEEKTARILEILYPDGIQPNEYKGVLQVLRAHPFGLL